MKIVKIFAIALVLGGISVQKTIAQAPAADKMSTDKMAKDDKMKSDKMGKKFL